MKTLFFIPTYNDFELLSDIQQEIYNTYKNSSIIVINDGSTITVKNIDNRSTYLELKTNYGIGVTTLIAVDYMIDFDFDYLVRIDADGQHSVCDASKILEGLSSGSNLVIANRINNNTGLDIRNFAKFIIGFIGYVATRKLGIDFNTGFFGIDKVAAQAVRGMRFDVYPEPKIYLSMIKNKLIKVASVEVEQNDREFGKSSISLLNGVAIVYKFFILSLDSIIKKDN
jgi:glycosyltransferase involved in cell wall biosynthesis